VDVIHKVSNKSSQKLIMFGEDEGVKLYERKKGKQQKESQDYTVFKTNGVGFT